MGKRPPSSRLRTAWDSLRTSFWFVPSVMMVLASGLAAFGFWLDFSLSGQSERQVPWWVYFSRPDDARDVLSTILSSMITMTSLVFSVTIVVLSLAANQLHLLRVFFPIR